MKALTPSPADRVEYEAPQGREGRRKAGQATLEGARRADAEEPPHPEAEIERAGMHEQPFQHVFVAADVRAAKPAGLVEMRARSLEQFAAPAEEPFAAATADAAAIRIHGITLGFLITPRLRSTIRFADVGTDLQRLQIVHHRAAVIALVGHDLLDHDDRIISNGGHRFELFGGLGQRLLDRARVARVGILHGDRDDSFGLEIVFPLTKRAAPRHCSTQVNTARCVSSATRRRVREIVEWSGGCSSKATPRKSRSANGSAAHHAMPRSESMPSKYPISSNRK